MSRAAQLRPLTEIVSETIAQHRMLRTQQRVLAAFSGGADSTALAIVLKRLGYDVVLGHVDHSMRPDSAADAGAASTIADRLGLPIQVARGVVDPPTEEQARRVRYRLLEEMASSAGAPRIATGHTLDDEAETTLMRLARGGTGVGIPPVRGNIVRPLIRLRRADTERICRVERIEFLSDPSNQDLRFRRNLIRARVLSGLSDDVVTRLGRLGTAAGAEAADTRTRAEVILRSELRFGDEGLKIDIGRLKALPPRLVEAALRGAMEAVVSREVPGRTVALVSGKLDETGWRVDLPGGWALWPEGDQLTIGRIVEGEPVPGAFAIDIPGTTVNEEWGLRVEAEEAQTTEEIPKSPLEALFDASKLGPPWAIRARRTGDRFRPLGMKGFKKLQDFFVDEKVPRRVRDRTPLLTSAGEIAWVVGHRIDDRFRIKGSIGRAWRLMVRELP